MKQIEHGIFLINAQAEVPGTPALANPALWAMIRDRLAVAKLG